MTRSESVLLALLIVGALIAVASVMGSAFHTLTTAIAAPLAALP